MLVRKLLLCFNALSSYTYQDLGNPTARRVYYDDDSEYTFINSISDISRIKKSMDITDSIISEDEAKRLLRAEMTRWNDHSDLQGQDMCVFKSALFFAQQVNPLPPFQDELDRLIQGIHATSNPGDFTVEDILEMATEHVYEQNWRARLDAAGNFIFIKWDRPRPLVNDNYCAPQA